jgi:hypothetical protein
MARQHKATAVRSISTAPAAPRPLTAAPPLIPRPDAPVAPSLVAARLVAFDHEARAAQLDVGGVVVDAILDEALSPRVLATALARGERVVAQREEAGWVVLGALRTAPTPGVDEGDEFLIKARRVAIAVEHEFAVVSGLASLAVRAQGFVETLAHDITTRASGIHKIAGRIIRLN